MSEYSYGIVGSWGLGDGAKGISIFSYDQEYGTLNPVETVMESVCATQLAVDIRRGMVYAVDTRDNTDGNIGGGGYVIAFCMDEETGKLKMINRKETHCAAPDYLWLDQSGNYLLVAHHASRGHVTRVVRREDGEFDSITQFDDAALVLFRMEADGSIGEICDVSVPGLGKDEQAMSHLHFVMPDPAGELYLVSDKGMDHIYSYRLDRERGKLIYLNSISTEKGSSPRYGVFHPSLPVFYGNHEKNTTLNLYGYDVVTGKLTLKCTYPLLVAWQVRREGEGIEAADLKIHPNGRFLYASVRGLNIVSVFEIDAEGGLTLKQNIDCGGINPRGLCISPDGRFLFTTNTESCNVVTFRIEENGMLRATPFSAHANMAACMKVWSVQENRRE